MRWFRLWFLIFHRIPHIQFLSRQGKFRARLKSGSSNESQTEPVVVGPSSLLVDDAPKRLGQERSVRTVEGNGNAASVRVLKSPVTTASVGCPKRKTIGGKSADYLARGERPHLREVDGHGRSDRDRDASSFENLNVVGGSVGKRNAVLAKLLDDHVHYFIYILERFLFGGALRDRAKTTQSRAKGMVPPLVRFDDHLETVCPHSLLQLPA